MKAPGLSCVAWWLIGCLLVGGCGAAGVSGESSSPANGTPAPSVTEEPGQRFREEIFGDERLLAAGPPNLEGVSDASFLYPVKAPPGVEADDVRIEIAIFSFDDEVTGEVLVRDSSEPAAGAVVSVVSVERANACNPDSGLDWVETTIRSGPGCVLVNEFGLVFAEWQESGRIYHAESDDIDRDALVDYLETWEIQKPPT